MREQMIIVRKYLTYLDNILHKKDMGYPISKSEYDKLEVLRQEALTAKQAIIRETEYIKKTLKRVK